MNKKAGVMDIFILIIIAFVLVLFFAGWMYGFNAITNAVEGVGVVGSGVNISEIGEDTFGNVNEGLRFLPTMAFLIVFAMAVSILISNFLVRAHPVFYIVYILIGIIATIFSAIVSNAYEALLSGNILSDTIAGFTGMNFFMLNLPIIVGVITIFGAIFLFINIPRDEGIVGSDL